ncbi:hypothetical protein H0H81_002884, partial [Sphagnurus paluster]
HLPPTPPAPAIEQPRLHLACRDPVHADLVSRPLVVQPERELSSARPMMAATVPQVGTDPDDVPAINGTAVLADAARLQDSFDSGFNGEDREDGDEGDGDREVEDEDGIGPDDRDPSVVNRPDVVSAMNWVDEFILNSRRKSGRQTEASVVKL